MKFLLDANFLLIPAKFKVDIFFELTRFGKPELCTLDLVVGELKKTASGKGADARHAKLALTLIEKKNVRILKTKHRNTDQEIERIAAEHNMVVCTLDRQLIKKLKAEEIPVVSLRKKKRLELV